MTDISPMEWVGVAFAVVVFAAIVLLWLVSRARLMRCPETGSVAFVDADPLAIANGETAQIRVRRCDLWPKRQGCTQRCLVRYSETALGYQVGLEALRPFDRS